MQARTVMKDGRLSIMNAYKSDSGLYKCKASNNLGHDSAVTQLNVVELPHFTVSPPSQLNVSTVQNITVSCQAAGDPQPTIMWRKEGGKLPAGRSSASADGTLKIWNLREREDSGRYTCVASSNQFFKAFSVMDVIIVQHKGEFKLKFSSDIVKSSPGLSADTCLLFLLLFFSGYPCLNRGDARVQAKT